jgi:hypothetical protein
MSARNQEIRMNFLEDPNGGCTASGLIVNLQRRDDAVEGFDRNGQGVLWISTSSYDRQTYTLFLLKEWMRNGKRAKQPDWTYLYDDEVFAKCWAEFTDLKRS